MQKKPSNQQQAHAQNTESDWQNNLKKQQRKEMMKKIAIWAGIVIACFAGLALLVQLASKSGPTATPVVNERLKQVLENDIVVGNPDAKVVIYEYADFQCPACASYNPVTNQVLAEYDGKVKIVYRFFPLRGIHKNAAISAQAAFAAWKLGKFTEMKDKLYDSQNDWENLGDPREVFGSYAASLGMDEAKFLEIMNSKEAEDAILATEADAMSLGINSTPTFFIGNRQFTPSGFDSFKSLIEEELQAK